MSTYDRDLNQRINALIRSWVASAKEEADPHSAMVFEQCAGDLRVAVDDHYRGTAPVQITDDTMRCMDQSCLQHMDCARFRAEPNSGSYSPAVETLRAGTGCTFFIDVDDL